MKRQHTHHEAKKSAGMSELDLMGSSGSKKKMKKQATTFID
jgi:hypothetical protein